MKKLTMRECESINPTMLLAIKILISALDEKQNKTQRAY
ncbi:putative inner membrane protein [Salmonella enterica subsp. enterica serovar Heidelberg str. N4403]|nr:putative inner membrane protein [Salmonella enterica subsp. enterica serovar Heidelberg str. N4403]